MPLKKYAAPRLATVPATPKARKPRAPMPRPPGLTNAQWKSDVDRRVAVTNDRRNRLNMKKARDAATEQEAPSRLAMANERPIFPPQQAGPFPQGTWSSQQSVASSANFSPPVWGYASSPEYANGNALGGFNPNTTFPRTPSAFTAGHNAQYGYSLTYSGSSATALRRDPMPFAPGSAPQFSNADTEMEEIITNGSTTMENTVDGSSTIV